MFAKFIKNDKGMITVESLIVFPLIIMIIFVFFAYLLLEFEKSNIVLRSNSISLDALAYQKKLPPEDEFFSRRLIKTPFTEHLEIKRDIRLTNKTMPKFTTIDIYYKNKSINYKKFNILIFKRTIIEAVTDKSESEN